MNTGLVIVPSFVDITPIRAALERGDLVLTHSLRLAREVRHAFAAAQISRDGKPGVTLAPRAVPLEAWFESLWRERVESGELPVRRLLSRFEERMLWREIIEESLEKKGDFQLLLPAVAAERASHSRRALLLHAGADIMTDPRFDYDLDGKIFADWSQTFQRRLAETECITREDAYRELLQLPRVEGTVVVPFQMPPVPPLFEKLIDHLGEGARASAETGEGGRGPRKERARFGRETAPELSDDRENAQNPDPVDGASVLSREGKVRGIGRSKSKSAGNLQGPPRSQP